MIKFILIAGVWVNVNNITSLTPKKYKDLCLVTVNGAGTGGYDGVWYAKDGRPCEEIMREIEKLEARK